MQFGKYLSLAAVAAPMVSAAAVGMSPRDYGLSSENPGHRTPHHRTYLHKVSVSYADAYLNETLNVADYGCGTAVNGTVLEKVFPSNDRPSALGTAIR